MTAGSLLVAGGVGVAAGLLYFEGLWWTVSRLAHARRPSVLLGASFLTRTSVLLATLLAVATHHGAGVVAAVAGVLAARSVAVRRHRPPTPTAGRLSWS